MKRSLDVAVRLAILAVLLCPAIGFSQKVRAERQKVVDDLASPNDLYLRRIAPRQAS